MMIDIINEGNTRMNVLLKVSSPSMDGGHMTCRAEMSATSRQVIWAPSRSWHYPADMYAQQARDIEPVLAYGWSVVADDVRL